MKKARNFSRLLAMILTMVMVFALLPAFTAASGNITVYVTFEGYNLGHGFYIEPTPVTVPGGSFVEVPTRQVLEYHNHTFDGDHPEGFFLDNISGFNRGYINPPDFIPIQLRESDAVAGGNLAAFMFSSDSGWMVTVNHVKIDVGAGSMALTNGDVIRWQFSVYGHGVDLGVPMSDWAIGTPPDPLYIHEDKTELIRALFHPNANQEARQTALDVIINPLASALDVENAFIELLGDIDLPSGDGYFDGWYVVHNPDGNLREILLRIVEDKYDLPPLNLTGVTNTDVPLLRERLSSVQRLKITGTMNTHDFRPGNAAVVSGWGAGLLAQNSNAGLNFTNTGFAPMPFITHAAILNNLVELDIGAVTVITNENGAAINNYPNRAFRGLRNIEKVRLPADRELSNGMFQYAQSLTAITFGSRAFLDNTFDFRGLEVLPFGGSFNFQHSGVREVIFPAELTNLPNSIFSNNSNLHTVHFYNETAPTIAANSFNNINPRPVAIVPNNTVGGYELPAFFNHFSVVISRDGGGLELLPLFNLINSVSAMDNAAFTVESWSDVAVALSAANDVLHNITGATGQSEVDYALDELQAAINALEVRLDNVTFLDVPAGANVGAFRKGNNHFAPFIIFPISLHEELGEREVWRAAIPTGQAFHIEVYVPGETAKLARRMNALTAHGATITLDPTPLGDWVDGRGEAWHNANVYTNLGDCGTLNLAVGETFDLDTFRVWQAMDNILLNYFIEPEYVIEAFGESANYTRIGSPGRERIRIEAIEPGVSVIKITYNPIEYVRVGGGSLYFDAIDPRNTLAVVVNVDGGTDFDTGINVRNDFDVYYYDVSTGFCEFTFTPEDGSTVRVHQPLNAAAWGDGWEAYTAKDDGSFTVQLHSGRNIIEVTNGGNVRFHTIHARGVNVTIENLTNPGSRYFAAGEVAQISVTGLMKPIEKLAGLYNPGFGTALRAFILYTDGNVTVESDRGSVEQFTTLTDTFTVTHTVSGTEANVLNGQIHVGHMGSPLGAHRNIPLGGTPANMLAIAAGPYAFGALPEIVLPIRKFDGPNVELLHITEDLANADYLDLSIMVNDPFGELSRVMVMTAIYDSVTSRFCAGTARFADVNGQPIEINGIPLLERNGGNTLRVFVWCDNMTPIATLRNGEIVDEILYSRDIPITVFVSFEGYNLGHGFYIEPTAMTLPAGLTGEDATRALLTQNGHTFSGESDWGFMLDHISGFNRGFMNPPPYLTITLTDDTEEGGTLSNFMYAPFSGWLVTVNHFMLDVGIDYHILNDGDVLRWQFSVEGFGADLGITPEFGGWGGELYEHADKTALIRALFRPNVNAAARAAALEVIIDPLATALQVADALAAIKGN